LLTDGSSYLPCHQAQQLYLESVQGIHQTRYQSVATDHEHRVFEPRVVEAQRVHYHQHDEDHYDGAFVNGAYANDAYVGGVSGAAYVDTTPPASLKNGSEWDAREAELGM
jgi:hypothetical protein